MHVHGYITTELYNALFKICFCIYNELNRGIWSVCTNSSVPNESKLGRTRPIKGDTEIECHYDILKYDTLLLSKF